MTVLNILLACAILHTYSAFSQLTVTNLLNLPLTHPDTPIYDSRTDLLYFIDNNNVYCYDYQTKYINHINLGNSSTPIIPSKGSTKEFLVGVGNTIERVIWDCKSSVVHRTVFAVVYEGDKLKKFNDGKADKKGRAWLGIITFIDGNSDRFGGSIFRVNKENVHKPELVAYNVTDPEGISFNTETTKFYYSDAENERVIQHDYDLNSGKFWNPKVIFDLNTTGLEDVVRTKTKAMVSMTRDVDDNLWIGLYSKYRVIKVDPNTGGVLQEVLIPYKYVINLSWGGKDLDILFVTALKNASESSGTLFSVEGLGTRGVPADLADIF